MLTKSLISIGPSKKSKMQSLYKNDFNDLDSYINPVFNVDRHQTKSLPLENSFTSNQSIE